jgi:FkbH-like protein
MNRSDDSAIMERAPEAGNATAGEPVRLVIWDLDDTFWQGTLSESEILPIRNHIDMIRIFSARGIVNSICSKNDPVLAQENLTRLGVWEYFVFPRIAFAPKGEMIREIIAAAQLRAPSVLFIDDHPMNLNEALHYNPGLQLAGPDILATLLDDPRCQGKPDHAMQRLARYKVLEQKQAAQAASGGDNLEFLRASAIRISLHYDVIEQFPRIHELVNRSNQLNFTKRRWPEDAGAALIAAQEEFNAVFNSHWGYVKVSDRYGSYGICGFFMTRHSNALHFLFSCRAMNMGVEQFLWHVIGKPKIISRKPVEFSADAMPDWISVVDDADSNEVQARPDAQRPLLCLRGACDLSMMAHYLRTNFVMIEEYQYPYEGWVVHRTAREIAVAEVVKTPALQELLARLPSAPPERFESAVHTKVADVYVLSFSSEIFGGLKRSRSTGVIVPLCLAQIGAKAYADFSHEQVLALQKKVHFTAGDWDYLQQEYESVPYLDAELLTADLHCLFGKLVGKQVIILKLNASVGGRKATLDIFGRINDIVLPVARQYGCRIIDIAEFVRGIGDLIDPDDAGVHYSRNVYRQLASRIEELISDVTHPPVAAPASIAAGRDVVERGTGNILEIDATARINAPVRVRGSHNRLFIGKDVKLDGAVLEIVGNNCSIVINDGVRWRGILRCRHDDTHIEIGRKTTSMDSVVTLHEAGRITIGEDCMFSGDVRMDVSDMHSIMDRATGQRINQAQNIEIGDHVWLAHGVTVLKGCQIGSGCVVGAQSLVGGSIPENAMVAGQPAKIIRENVAWSRQLL